MNVVILAGGTGTRLWPVSRIFNPKQFTKFKGMGKSTFQATVERALKIASAEKIFIVTNIEYKYFVFGHLQELGVSIPEENILLEPSFKNTLHAVSVGVFNIVAKKDENVSVLVIPSNSDISNYEELFANLRKVSESLNEEIVTFGIKSTGVYVGYGYIKTGETNDLWAKVLSFVEKPSAENALKFVNEGYLYNSGVLLFKAGVYLKELKKFEPELYRLFTECDLNEVYSSKTRATVERGILERSDNLVVLPLKEQWQNINEFSSFYRQYDEKQDINGNISFGEDVFIDSKNNFVYSETDKAVGIIGADDLIIIDQPDALLVCNNKDTSRVREIANILKDRGDSRADYHTTCYRPWGSYTVLEEGAGYKIKRITVLPGKKLSYQLHYHRSEHWVVVTGTAKIVRNDTDIVVKSGESIFLSVGEKHRMENPGKTTLEVIEVQIGGYLGEDDIVRFEDDFGR